MKLTVLADNNTITDKYFLGEPAFSIFIEADGKNILFDTGYSDVFMKNAQTAQINLKTLDFIVLSHGHDDHTGGLKHLVELFKDTAQKPQITACPNVFEQRYDKDGEFGAPVSKEEIEDIFDIVYTQKPYFLTKNIVFLGEIKRTNNFEAQTPVGYLKKSNEHDFVYDDSALVIKTEKGLVIVTGCSHSGIVNICEQAKEIFENEKISVIIGGLHLKDASQTQIEKTAKYIKDLNLDSLYACHCTGFNAQCKLSTVTNLKETGSGLVI